MRLSKLILFFVAILTLPSITQAGYEYSAEWWKHIPKKGTPQWEILPHEADPGEVILSKRNDLGILSNFAATPFVLDGKTYASVEGFWQMMKYPENPQDSRAKLKGVHWKYTRDEVAQMTAFEAKAAGDAASKIMKEKNINWVTYKGKRMSYRFPKMGKHYKTIKRAMWAKLSQNPKVKRILLRTGKLVLRPDHHQKNPPPAWQYHKIWMEIRSKIQADKP